MKRKAGSNTGNAWNSISQRTKLQTAATEGTGVKTNGGSIHCESQLLFEFGNLGTKRKGKISVKKLQGKEFCVETENGTIDVGASYVLKAQLSSESGHIKLGDIHGEHKM